MKKKSKLICAGVAGLMAVAIVGSMGLAFFSETALSSQPLLYIILHWDSSSQIKSPIVHTPLR